MKKDYLLSIVVPTKNRYKYLMSLIQLIKNFQSEDIELVIQDNTAVNDEIIKFIDNEGFVHLKYFHTKENLSISQNSDLAILNSTGKYICFIGDDDGVLSSILNIVKYAEMRNIESIVTPRLTYVWPDAEKYITYLKTDKQIQRYDCSFQEIDKDEIIKVLNKGGQSMCNMPRVYHGIVLRETLDKLWSKYGTYFPGPSPDMANAITLTILGVNTLFVNYPAIIAGTGYVRIMGNEKGDRQPLKDSLFLNQNVLEKWDNRIPKIWTTPTIYAQTVYQCVNDECHELIKQFNWKEFYISLGAEFFMDYWKIVPNDIRVALVFKIMLRKMKNLIYRNFKTIINWLRGYKTFDCNYSTVGDYAMSVEKYIGSFHYNHE